MCMLWLFYTNIGDDSHGLFSKNGMILNILGLTIGSSILTTISICECIVFMVYLIGFKSIG